MGLALLIVVLKTLALRHPGAHYDRAARFWARIFGITFAMGVVTGIPMEFQFGTHWAALLGGHGRRDRPDSSPWRASSPSSSSRRFLGAFLFGEKRLKPRGALAASRSCSGSAPGSPASSSSPRTPGCSTRWATCVGDDGVFQLTSLAAAAHEPWAPLAVPAHDARRRWSPELRHGGPRRLLPVRRQHEMHARTFVRPGRDRGARRVREHGLPDRGRPGQNVAASPAGSARRDGRPLPTSKQGAPMVLIGQPDMEQQRSTTRSRCPEVLSLLT